MRRYDAGRLDKATRTPSGGIKVPARISRTGVQVYKNADGSERREYRPAEQVFDAKALASLGGAPVTKLHPSEGVHLSNWQAISAGHVSDKDPGREKVDAEEFVVTDLFVQRADVIDDVAAGKLVECSVGYDCDLVFTPGVAPSGERYDAIQTNIRVNHVALGPENWARAGSAARLRLDGGEIPPDPPEEPRVKIKLDGIEYDKGSDAHVSALEKGRADAEAARGAADKALADEKAAHDKTKADAAETAGKLAAADAKLKVYSDAEAAKAGEAFRADMTTVLGKDYKFDGKDEPTILGDAIAKLGGKCDSKEVVVLRAYLGGLRSNYDHNKAPRAPAHEDGSKAPAFVSLESRFDKHYAEANK